MKKSTPPGAFLTDKGVRYRVWAPEKKRVDVVLYHAASGDIRRTQLLEPVGGGFFEGTDESGVAGDLYKYRLDSHPDQTFPDPLSRFQPKGVHGPSQVVAQGTYQWRQEANYRRVALDDLVIYELHVGTFTQEGTFLSAIQQLDSLVDLGVTAIELMPLADFPGRWNWGYDGVYLYAPARAYGRPDDLRALVDAAHGRGLAVILDAVYNHLGPDGNYLGAYTKDYFNPAHKTPWGDALNFDGHHNGPVRDYFLSNPVYWMEEFHLDGFRLDATHAIMDDSPRHILAEIAGAIHARGGFVYAEDERNAASLATPEAEGGCGLDGMWADDFHHSVRVALTGERDSYLGNFRGSAEEIAETLSNGWYYRGQRTLQSGKPRGTPGRQLPPRAFCYCISNHDQVGNRAFGERLNVLCGPDAYRAASALLCLSPHVPLIFQGQEWMASTPFLYFTDHNEELGRLVTEGRRKEFAGFAAFADEESVARIPDPQAEKTFCSSKLVWDEIPEGMHHVTRDLYKEALRLRRTEPALGPRLRDAWQVKTLGERIVALSCADHDSGENCLVMLNLRGGDVHPTPIGAVPPVELIFSSNEKRFGGNGYSAYNAADRTLCFDRAELLVLRWRGTPPAA